MTTKEPVEPRSGEKNPRGGQSPGTPDSPGDPEEEGEPQPNDPPKPDGKEKGGKPAKPSPGPPESPEGESNPHASNAEEPDEQDKRPYLKRVADDEREWHQRQESLRDLDDEEVTASAGRDFIGGASNRVSGDGQIINAGRDFLSINLGASRGKESPIRYLEPSEAEKLMNCLVEPPMQPELKSVLKDEPLVFLRGAASTGRRLAALAALLCWARANGTADAVEAQERVGIIISLGSPFYRAGPELHPYHGYVLDATNRGNIEDIDALAEHLRDLATKRSCRVILLVTAGRSDLRGQVVDHRPPSAPEVFRSQLRHEALAADVDVGLLDEMREELDDDLRHESSPQRAAALASQLVRGLKSGLTLDDLRAELPQQMRDDIRQRLDENGPVLGRCFMTSAAVLNDLPEATVSDAAVALAEQINKVASIKAEERLPAWEQLQSWLEYAAATTSPAQVAGGGRIVRLKRRAKLATLRVLWEDHPAIREPLVTWLCNLATGTDEQVQMKAAHAAGVLATFDYDIVVANFLTPWSKSKKLRDHRLAAMMLESAARDDDLAPRVYDTLRKLADGSRGERLVAAHAYGSRIGISAPDVALRDLRKLAIGRDTEVGKAVAGSIGNLYSAEMSERILSELKIWVECGSPGGLYTSALAFIRLARIGAVNDGQSALIAVRAHEDFIECLRTLWTNALSLRLITYRTNTSELVVPDSWEVLAQWARRYEDEPVARSVIDSVIAAGSTQLRNAFLLHMWRWRHRNIISEGVRKSLIELLKGG